ncbi:MAG: peptide chain release factor N(5)-glutamine methyltransferase [Acidimicrobiia bacterium]
MGATWRALRGEIAATLAAGGVENAASEARFMVEEASGFGATEWSEAIDVVAPARAEARLFDMCARRLRGEPLQYVLGAWSFRGLDLMVDRRVLIPRPETEWVVEVALEEAARLGFRRSRRRPGIPVEARARAVDLGTGSGAIALALEAELPEFEVWATDASEDALAVASANIAGCGATRVRVASGRWFGALPAARRGQLALVVTNPPYIATDEVPELPPAVIDYEPRAALVSGASGLEALTEVIGAAPDWLAPEAALVCEIAPHQAAAVVELARAAGFHDPFVRPDLTGRPRVLVARRGSGGPG